MLISIPQFMLRKQEFLTEPGACYYIEIALIFINILLTVVSYLSYAKARKTNFPKQRNPYEISAESYGYAKNLVMKMYKSRKGPILGTLKLNQRN